MADFCTKCAEELFGKEVSPEIDVLAIAEALEPDTWTSVLCEGCGMLAVSRHENGNPYVGLPDGSGEYIKWYRYDEFYNQVNSKIK